MSSGDLASNQAAATLEDEWPGGDLGGKRERRFWVRAASAFYLLYAVGVLIPELLTSTSLELLRWSIYAGIVTLFAALSLI
ncbi:MAG TPA: hypothetical protein VM534_10060, partial [Thermoanaerobaculia bacterium]|nr:hypothetical protein [Thermoanaerobaculia bacterium]